ncbi:MAG TPA: DUF885 family protein [Longimicrobiales bacterium]|nr:DUF885 family protein [Longimicrobiales bacterium]
MKINLIGAALLAACGGPAAPPTPPPVPVFSAQSGFARVASEFLDAHEAAHPVDATRAGSHAHDARLPSVFPGDLERRSLDVRAYLTRLEGVSPRTLRGADAVDYRLIDHALRAELLDLEEVGGWRRDPARYAALARDGTSPLVLGRFAPLEERMRSMAGRWHETPMLLRAARQNLDASLVPGLLADHAADVARATRAFIADDVPVAVDAQGLARVDVRALNEWEAARRRAVASLDSFTVWLERDLAARAAGDFRLGSHLLQRTLLYRHHLDIPLGELYALNRQAIDEYREWMGRVAMTVDPMRRPHVIIDSLTAAVRGGSELIPPRLAPPPIAPEGSSARSRVRALLAPTALAESWLHYTDLTALSDPAIDDATRLAGIRRALHGHALLHAMLTLHSGEASLEEAARDFASIALVDLDFAERETRRVAIDPGAAVPAIGRMQIFALRDRLRAERRGAFDEEAFERDLIGLGLPVPLAAAAMLGREPGPLLVTGVRTPGLPPLPGPLQR